VNRLENVTTWEQVVSTAPDFAEWAIERYGSLPVGPVDADDLTDKLFTYLWGK
jgi:hypothetical protein